MKLEGFEKNDGHEVEIFISDEEYCIAEIRASSRRSFHSGLLRKIAKRKENLKWVPFVKSIKRCGVNRITCLPEYRRQGIGSALIMLLATQFDFNCISNSQASGYLVKNLQNLRKRGFLVLEFENEPPEDIEAGCGHWLAFPTAGGREFAEEQIRKFKLRKIEGSEDDYLDSGKLFSSGQEEEHPLSLAGKVWGEVDFDLL